MIYYISIELVIIVHNMFIDRYGGLPGIYNLGLLESVLENIQNDTYYPRFIDKFTHLFFSIIKYHCFADGNKRTAIVCATMLF